MSFFAESQTKKTVKPTEPPNLRNCITNTVIVEFENLYKALKISIKRQYFCLFAKRHVASSCSTTFLISSLTTSTSFCSASTTSTISLTGSTSSTGSGMTSTTGSGASKAYFKLAFRGNGLFLISVLENNVPFEKYSSFFCGELIWCGYQ